MSEQQGTPENLGALRGSSAGDELKQRLWDEFSFKRNVLDAVRSGKGLKEAVNALPSAAIGGEVWKWLDGVQWYTRRIDQKASDRAERAKQMIIDRFKG